MIEIGCSWACVSKQPRDSSDYRVLSCSSGQLAKYQALELPDRPGTPTIRVSGRVESLPWVTFGRHRDDGHQLTMSIMRWADHQDADGRPVTLTRFFLLPYAQLPGTAAYADLYRAAAGVPLPPEPSTDLVTLTLPDTPPPARHDLSWAAATAAVLLESRVIITGLLDADTESRLAAVDAITRLLPRGYRADLSVASWVSYPAQRWQRLCFGPYAAGDLTEVRLDTHPEPRSPTARKYHALLLRYLERQQEDLLIEWLARYSAPLSFDADPLTALDILQDLDLADAVVEEVRTGRGRWRRVRRALTERGPEAFNDQGRYDVFRFGLAERKVDVGKELRPYWSPLLCAAVVAAAHQGDGPADRDRIASAFVPVATEHGDLDAYLTHLITPGVRDDAVPAEMFTVCLRALLNQPSPPRWPLLRRRLLDHVPSGVSLVIECQDPHPERVPYVLGWLFDGHPVSAPAWLAVLHHVATGDPEGAGPITGSTPGPTAGLLEEAIAQNPSTALQALDIAGRRAAWDRLDPALWRHLIATAARPPADPSRQVLVRELASLAPIDASPRARAYLDVLLETCGAPAANPPLGTVALGGYVEELAAAIACLSPGQRPEALRGLTLHVLETLTAETSAGGADPAAEFLLALLNRVPVAETLAEAVAEILERPGCGGLLRPLTTRGGEPWERLIASSDRLRLAVPRVLFEEAALGDASAAELARCWAPIILAEQRLDVSARRPSLQALAGWSSGARPGELLELIELTRAQLVESGMPAGAGAQWREDTIIQVARTRALGKPAAEALIASLRLAAARTAEANARRLREIERHEAQRCQRMRIIQDELARLAAERAEMVDEQRREEDFISGLSARPKRSWAPAVLSGNDTTREPVGEKKGRSLW